MCGCATIGLDAVDLLASVKRGKATASTRYAHYRTNAFATDTGKAWLQLGWSL